MKTLIAILFVTALFLSSCGENNIVGSKFDFTKPITTMTSDGQEYQNPGADSPELPSYRTYVSIYRVQGSDTVFYCEDHFISIPSNYFPIEIFLWTNPLPYQQYQIKVQSNWDGFRENRNVSYSIYNWMSGKEVSPMFSHNLTGSQSDLRIGTYYRSDSNVVRIYADYIKLKESVAKSE